MSWGFVIQTLVSTAAIAGLVALAAWARIAAPRAPLDLARARALISEEFPTARIEGVWVAADGRAALARTGGRALVVFLRGDDYVARAMAWSEAAAARIEGGAVRLAFGDIAAPGARLVLGEGAAWPPALEAAR
jgi:hypothetical protein